MKCGSEGWNIYSFASQYLQFLLSFLDADKNEMIS